MNMNPLLLAILTINIFDQTCGANTCGCYNNVNDKEKIVMVVKMSSEKPILSKLHINYHATIGEVVKGNISPSASTIDIQTTRDECGLKDFWPGFRYMISGNLVEQHGQKHLNVDVCDLKKNFDYYMPKSKKCKEEISMERPIKNCKVYSKRPFYAFNKTSGSCEPFHCNYRWNGNRWAMRNFYPHRTFDDNFYSSIVLPAFACARSCNAEHIVWPSKDTLQIFNEERGSSGQDKSVYGFKCDKECQKKGMNWEDGEKTSYTRGIDILINKRSIYTKDSEILRKLVKGIKKRKRSVGIKHKSRKLVKKVIGRKKRPQKRNGKLSSRKLKRGQTSQTHIPGMPDSLSKTLNNLSLKYRRLCRLSISLFGDARVYCGDFKLKSRNVIGNTNTKEDQNYVHDDYPYLDSRADEDENAGDNDGQLPAVLPSEGTEVLADSEGKTEEGGEATEEGTEDEEEEEEEEGNEEGETTKEGGAEGENEVTEGESNEFGQNMGNETLGQDPSEQPIQVSDQEQGQVPGQTPVQSVYDDSDYSSDNNEDWGYPSTGKNYGQVPMDQTGQQPQRQQYQIPEDLKAGGRPIIPGYTDGEPNMSQGGQGLQILGVQGESQPALGGSVAYDWKEFKVIMMVEGVLRKFKEICQNPCLPNKIFDGGLGQQVYQGEQKLDEANMPDGICLAPPKDKGKCKNKVRAYSFNPETKKCEFFEWSGCGGNQNLFMDFFVQNHEPGIEQIKDLGEDSIHPDILAITSCVKSCKAVGTTGPGGKEIEDLEKILEKLPDAKELVANLFGKVLPHSVNTLLDQGGILRKGAKESMKGMVNLCAPKYLKPLDMTFFWLLDYVYPDDDSGITECQIEGE